MFGVLNAAIRSASETPPSEAGCQIGLRRAAVKEASSLIA
jgi:hypothetical protein